MAESAASSAPEQSPRSVEVIDVVPRRVRPPLDLVRVCGLLLLLGVVAGLATVAQDAVQGANNDVTRILGSTPKVLIRVVSVLGTLSVLVLPVALVVRELVRSHLRRLVEGFVTGLIAIGLVGALDLAISSASSSSLHRVLTVVGTSTAARPLDAYLAALFAFAVVVDVGAEARWRTFFWLLTGVYIVSAFTAAQASLLSLVASPAIGALVAVLARYAVGSPNVRPDAERIAAELDSQGLSLVRMERVPAVGDEHRSYLATDAGARQLRVFAFDRDLVASGAIHGLYRRLRLRSEVAVPAALSLERIAERRVVLALAARAAAVRIPEMLASVRCGPECIALAYECVDGAPLQDPTGAQVAELWREAGKLNRRRIAHRGLAAGGLMLASDGHVVLPILTDGELFASEMRIRLDHAQLLVTTALLVGPERAAQVAHATLTDQELTDSLPLLQPIALSRTARSALKKHPGLLDGLRDQIEQRTTRPAPPPVRVERFRPRTVVSIAAAIIAGYLLIGQLGSVDLVMVFSTARWAWVPFVLLASAGTYLAAAVSLTGFVTEKLSFVRTVLAQIAASFAGFVTPPSVGGVAINVRYLRAAGVSTSGATTSVAVSQVVNGVLHAVLLIVFTAATGASTHPNLPIPSWVFIVVAGLAVVAGGILAAPTPRHWILARALPPLREAAPRLLELLSSPVKLSEAVGGTLLLNACYIAALWCSVHAFAGSISVTAVAVVYLAGAAVASVAPTPGGLGAVEIALSTGLTAAGMPGAAAISAVLLFRIATYWLPVPAGWLALRALKPAL